VPRLQNSRSESRTFGGASLLEGADVSLLSARQKEILRRLGSGQELLLPADFSSSPDRLTRVVAFQTIVSDVDALYREGMIASPEKEIESVAGGFYVVEIFVESLTAFGKDVFGIYEADRKLRGARGTTLG